jgi:hypothetical protein
MRRLLVLIAALGCGTAEAAAPPSDVAPQRFNSVQTIAADGTASFTPPVSSDINAPPLFVCYVKDTPDAPRAAILGGQTGERCVLRYANGQWTVLLQSGEPTTIAMFVAVF